jgi:hypothetical protein
MRLAHIAAIAELADVFPRVLGRNVNVSALDGSLKQRPMALQSVHMTNAANMLFH